MKVKELIDLLLDCDKDLEVVSPRYEDCYSVKEETVHSIRNNGEKTSSSHVILEFTGEVHY